MDWLGASNPTVGVVGEPWMMPAGVVGAPWMTSAGVVGAPWVWAASACEGMGAS